MPQLQGDFQRSEPGPNRLSIPALLPNLDIEPLDLLIERREGTPELLRGVGLVPIASLELFNNDSPLNVFENVEERCVRIVLEQRILETAPRYVARQQVRSNHWAGGKHHAALNRVF